jgi:signal transduction histidine kinase
MTFGIRLRLIALVSALALMGALIVAVVLSSHSQAHELRARLSQVDIESFGIADQFKEDLRDVTDKMRAYRNTRDPAVWEDFLKAGRQLDAWIDLQAPKLTTQREKEVLKQIDSTYDEYLAVARNVHAHMESTGETNVIRAESTGLPEHARRLSDLGQSLARAHYDSRNALLAHANLTLTHLRMSVLGLLGLLFVTGVTLAMVVYMQMIAPLQLKLGESIALAERNEKLASLGMLAAGVAHEIRNPLTAIKGALFIQQKKFRPGSQERSDADLVQREIGRLERIVDDFLQFARPAEPELATVSADLPLQEAQGLLATHLAKSGIQLVREKSPELKIEVDPAQIKQVLINLIQNAAESLEDRGVITLRARHDRKHLSNGETNVVVLEVADTGKGISPEVERRLFDPFFTTKASGTGLGLPIAARIVQKHGGALQYKTRVNEGTTFSVVLPEVTT